MHIIENQKSFKRKSQFFCSYQVQLFRKNPVVLFVRIRPKKVNRVGI